MAPIGMEKGSAARKSTMAAVAVLVALAAVPVLAETAQEHVISRLSSQPPNGGSPNTPMKRVVALGTTASVPMSREQEQGDNREKVIGRLASDTSRVEGGVSTMEKGQQPAALQRSLDPEGYRQTIRAKLHSN